MSIWEVQLKGSLTPDQDGRRSYELSVIKQSYRFGHESWGWGCENKIILFSDGLGGTNLRNDPDSIAFAMSVANLLKDALNNKEVG